MSDGNAARILIVDDDPDLREIYAGLLQHAGYSVVSADGGRAAVEALDRGHFDVILTDISMPDMDGLQLLRTVRQRDLDVPVVLMTGNPQVETAVQALDHGALRYLMKPVGEEALCQTVSEAVRLHHLAALKREALAQLGEEKLIGDRAGLEASFGRALDSLWMVYQPIVHAPDLSLYGYEALVRTGEPALTHPGALFDASERLGRVHDLGRAIRAAIARSRPTLGVPGSVFVNVHVQDLEDEVLFSRQDPLFAGAASVVLEVTERSALPGNADLEARVRALRGLGYRIAVDDFGAGYANLATFFALSPEVVKLDMALVRGVDTQPGRRRLLGSMIAEFKKLGTLVVAEGVETREERETLTEMGCDLLQGFLLGRPEKLPPSGS
jgi:EAL domain-containing protein (putative c-di-GMP-specific phosphodiesterase class I)